MSPNPYEAPTAEIEEIRDTSFRVPEEVSKPINRAAVAGAISGTLTLIMTLVNMSSPHSGPAAWTLLDVVLIFGLAFGIYKKSRICAVLLVVYFGYTKAQQLFTLGFNPGMLVGVLFLYFYITGAIATFQYHKLKNEA